MDTYTIFHLANEGLDALCAQEPRLAAFRPTLFAEESQGLVRELQTREVRLVSSHPPTHPPTHLPTSSSL